MMEALEAKQGGRRRRPIGSRVVATGALVGALLAAPVGGAPADSTWKTHHDQNCGIELKYPASYTLEASGAADHCALWLRIGVREARGLRALFILEISEKDSADRAEARRPRTPSAARDFALRLATAQCDADGADSTTSCTGGEVRSSFKTAQGFHGFEIHLTEVRETFSPKTIERRKKGPIFALDLSDDEVVRVLMARGEGASPDALRAILDTLRVWTRARRRAPRVVEMQPFLGASQAFAIRVAAGQLDGASRWPPSPVTSWFLTDPRGRRLGRDPATGTWHSEAPAVTHSAATGSGLVLREPLEGRYELQISASLPSVRYRVDVQAPDRAGKLATARHAGRTAQPGAVDRYEVVYSQASTPAVTIAEVRDAWRFTVLLHGRGDVAGELILTDPQGRRTGLDPVGKVEHRQIPRSSYAHEGAGRRSVALDVRQPIDGVYTLQVTGTAGSYSIDLRGWDRSGTAAARPELRDVPTSPGAVHLYRVQYAATGATPLKLGGRFGGSDGKSGEADRLLEYASPTSSETRLAPGATSFPLVVFYGARIRPVTFNAVLDGDNISGRFTPVPEGFQTVLIPLAAGLNTLVLSVEGTTADGQAASDTHRLQFRVE